MKVRCPICNGTGGVEPQFGTGCVNQYPMSCSSSKICPGCFGSGMQEVPSAPYYYPDNTTDVKI